MLITKFLLNKFLKLIIWKFRNIIKIIQYEHFLVKKYNFLLKNLNKLFNNFRWRLNFILDTESLEFLNYKMKIKCQIKIRLYFYNVIINFKIKKNNINLLMILFL